MPNANTIPEGLELNDLQRAQFYAHLTRDRWHEGPGRRSNSEGPPESYTVPDIAGLAVCSERTVIEAKRRIREHEAICDTDPACWTGKGGLWVHWCSFRKRLDGGGNA